MSNPTDQTLVKQPHGGALRPFQPGERANPAGRPVGARSKLSEAFLKDMLAAWQQNGARACRDALASDPMGFINAISRIVPKELEIGGSGQPIEGVLRIEFVKVQIEGKAE